MAKEPNLLKAAVKKPPANASKPAEEKTAPAQTSEESVAIKGKVVRKDPPARGSTQPIDTDSSPAEKSSRKTTECDGKIVRADPPMERTQAFSGATIDTDMPELESEAPPLSNRTQSVANETIDTEMPVAPAKRPSAPVQKQAGSTGAAPTGAVKGGAMATILDNKYKLLKKLGQGGMGTVYKGLQIGLDRVVAIKVLAKELASKDAYVQRFQREARVMIKLDHPNILRCLDAGFDEKRVSHYLTMEFVEGGSVEGYLKKLGRFSIGDALHIILKTAEGLQHAHEKSMIHRDIKPDNILLTKEGIVKVADLGLAKDTEEDTSLTKTGAGAGTPIYMAPEQARDVKHVDCRVDIYALGVMLYVFLTGKAPFQGNTLVELISAKEKGKFDPMRKHNDEVPGKLDLIVDKMIAKDPKSRYASCQEVIDDLEPLGLANEQLSFMQAEEEAEAAAPAKKTAPTSGPDKVAAKTSVGGAGKGPAAKTSTPVGAGQTAVAAEIEQDVWYWTFTAQNGKTITKKLSTEQIRALIKSGNLEATAQLSKSATSGARAAATYMDFQSTFKSLKTVNKANVKGQKYRDKYKEIEEEDARRRKWGWLSRMFKSFGSTHFGLLWIVLILGIVAGAGYFIYKYMN
jgi:serine/threonine-protein kinase